MTNFAALETPVLGLQRPRVCSLPPASIVLQNGGAGQEAIELSASAGLLLDPWQAYILEESLRERVDGKWAARNVCVICSRQNGKGSILEARELFGLFLGGEMELIHTAHQFKTSADHFKRIRLLIENTPDLKRELKPRGIRESHGEESITTKTGARLRFVARSVNGSGRGFTKIDMLAIDEAYQAGSGALTSLLPTQLASANAQTWYTSSALDKGDDSAALIRWRDLGRAGTSRQLAYFEHSSEPDASPDDPYARAQANPGLGTRLAYEELQSQRESMSDLDFLVEHMSVWPDTLGLDLIIDSKTWQADEDIDAAIVSTPEFGLDVDPSHSWACIAVSGFTADKRSLIEVTSRDGVIDHRPRTNWLIPRLIELRERFKRMKLNIVAGSGAESLKPELERLGFQVTTMTPRDMAAGCGLFYDLATTQKLVHLGQESLTDSLYSAKKRTEDGENGWIWGRKRSAGDITPLYATTLALWAANQAASADYDVAESIY